MSASPSPTPGGPVTPTPLTAIDRFWLDTARGAVKESVASLEEAAKQMIGVTTLAQTIYFAAISFSDVQPALAGLPMFERSVFAVALVVPIVLWVASLAFAVLVFKPEVYDTNLNSPEVAQETYQELITYKRQQLGWAHLFLVIGFAPLVLNILVYLILVPAPKP